jgi:hypothetical protein
VARLKVDRPAVIVSRPVAAVLGQVDQRAIGQLAHDLVQHHRRDGGGARAVHHGGGAVHHLDVQVGGAEADLRALGLDQHVGKDRDGVAPFHDRLRLCHGLEQRAAFDAEFHDQSPCPHPILRGPKPTGFPRGAQGICAGRKRPAGIRPATAAAQQLQIVGSWLSVAISPRSCGRHA